MSAEHPLRRALPLIVLAGICFATLDATAKFLVVNHTLLLVVWARYAGQMVVSTPIAWRRGGSGFWRSRHVGIQLVRSMCLVTATLCFFGVSALGMAVIVASGVWLVLQERRRR